MPLTPELWKHLTKLGILGKTVTGHAEFNSAIDKLEEKDHPVFILFRGNSGKDGKSWCPDCVRAEEVINKVLLDLDSKKFGAFIQVNAGVREEWKDPQSPFRTDPRLKLTCIPTIIKWNKKRIEDDKCSKPNVLLQFFGITS